MEEIWRDIPDYEGLYQVSNLGRVRSFKYGKVRILKSSPDKQGYHILRLCKNSICKSIIVHQLVAVCFLNHKICGHKLVVDHINDNKNDNTVENLQIVTQRYNVYKTQGNYSSKYKGVSFCNTFKKWAAMISINGKRKHLGRYQNEYDAHLAYQNALKNLEQ